MLRHTGKKEGGFTLIEIMISVTIAALMMGAAIPMMGAITGVNQRSAILRLSGNIKYLFDRAILDRLYIRLVIDLDKNEYWTESTRDPFFLTQKPLEVEDGAIVISEDSEEEEEFDPFQTDILFDTSDNYKWQGWGDFASKFRKKKAAFSTYKTDLSKRTKMPKGVKLFRVETDGVEEPVYAGQVYLHFFPNGFVERAVFWVVDDTDYEDEDIAEEDLEVYSLLVESLTGRSLIQDIRQELPEEEEDEEDW